MLWLLPACSAPPGPTTVSVPGEAGPLSLAASPSLETGPAVGAARLRIATDRPARLDVRWADERRRWPASEVHDVPLVGLGVGVTVVLDIRLTSRDGAVTTLTRSLAIDRIRSPTPDIDILALDAARSEPGHLLVHAKPPGERGIMLLFDRSLDVVWAWTPDRAAGDLRAHADRLRFVGGGGLYELDWTGVVTPVLTRSGAAPGRPLPAGVYLHHEAFPLDDGGWLSLDYRAVSVPRYPDVDGGEPADVMVERAVRLGPDGSLLADARFEQLLDLGRVNDNALSETSAGFDWMHANGIIADPRDGGWIVSSRHQSALFEIDPAGSLSWILASPEGWAERFRPRLLELVGDVEWPDAQHAPELDDDVLVVFDNRMLSGGTSRVVGYRIDEAAMTVEEAFVLDQTATGPERSRALGDADVQPVTGNVLATLGFLDGWGGQTADEMGIGKRAIAIVEWSRDAPEQPVVDLRLSERDRDGWKAYRAEKLPLPGARPE